MIRLPPKVPAANSRELIEIDESLVLVALYLCVNIIVACAFAWDKQKAKQNTWRTSENTLLVLALLGPFGALGAMKIFRHKTQKMKFWLVPLFLMLHLVVFACIFLKYW